MASVNPLSRELVFKIVYYGPGLGGKTTTLEHLHSSTKPEHRGKLVSLATPVDRTLYFDFLPLRLPPVRGMSIRLQLFTVPGQVYFNATRKLVLTGADGIVFVADSQIMRADANLESLENLRENLREQGRDISQVPMVFQYNKRDLPDLLPIPEMDQLLNHESVPSIATCARSGEGVYEALSKIAELVMRSFEAKMPARLDEQSVAEEIAEEGLASALRGASVNADDVVVARLETGRKDWPSVPPDADLGEASEDDVEGPLEEPFDVEGTTERLEPESLPKPSPHESTIPDDSQPPAVIPRRTPLPPRGRPSPHEATLLGNPPPPEIPLRKGGGREATLRGWPTAHESTLRAESPAPTPSDTSRDLPVVGDGLSFAELWNDADQPMVREVESAIANGRYTLALELCETLLSRVLASAANLFGTSEAPRDAAVVPLLLGLEGRRFLSFRSLVRSARSGTIVTGRDVLLAYAFVIDARIARRSIV